MNKLTLLAVLACTFSIASAKAPTHFSLRAESMGGAHVAVVDDKEAIHYNYAGLSQINRLGNYEKRPEQGYYPRNWIGDMRLTFGGAGDIFKFLSTYSDVKEVQDLFRDAQKDAGTQSSQTSAILDSLVKNPKYIKTLNSYDHKTIEARVKFDAEMAFHNFGAAFWINGSVAPYVDAGIILPFVVVDTFVIDAVAQMGGAYEIIPNELSVGLGAKIAKRHKTNMVTVGLANYSTIADTLKDQLGDATDNFFDSILFTSKLVDEYFFECQRYCIKQQRLILRHFSFNLFLGALNYQGKYTAILGITEQFNTIYRVLCNLRTVIILKCNLELSDTLLHRKQ